MKRFAIISVILTLLVSCSGMDATYQEFIKDGTALYVAKAENVVAQPGVNRIKLIVDRFTDARVETMTVYWDNRTYEQTFDVNLGGGNGNICGECERRLAYIRDRDSRFGRQ